MSEFKDIFERGNLEDMLSYLFFDTALEWEEVNHYDNKIDVAYKMIFDKLENMFPTASRDDDDLHDTIVEFALIHNKVFLELGSIIGFQIYQKLEHGYQNLEARHIDDMESVDKKLKKQGEKRVNDNLLDILSEERLHNAFEDALEQDANYVNTIRKIEKEHAKLIKKNFNQEQRNAIDKIIFAYNHMGAEYRRRAYKQGLQDGMKLISEIKDYV